MKKWKILLSLFNLLMTLSSSITVEAQERKITQIQPSYGSVGSQITIIGEGITPVGVPIKVYLNELPLPVVGIDFSKGQIIVTIPPGARTGNIVVDAGGFRITSSEQFQVVEPLTIIGFVPTEGVPGSRVTITGTGFSTKVSENIVSLNDVICKVVEASANRLVVEIPQGATTGHFKISVRGSSPVISSALFNVIGAPPPPPSVKVVTGKPVIDGFQPVAGPPGTIVRIIGKNFSPQDEVWLKGRRLNVVSVLPNRIEVEIPQGAESGRFVIRGRYTVESTQVFTVQSIVQPPLITSFSPKEGAPGTRVTIYGKNFGRQLYENRVMLSGQPIRIEESTPERLIVVIPDNAISGPFTVEVSGRGEAKSAEQFIVLEPLKIVTIEPGYGPPGTKVKLIGTGFSPIPKENIVKLNGVICRVVSALPHEILVEIPQRATSGYFSIRVKEQEVTSTQPFRIVFPPVITRFSPQEGTYGTQVVIYGANFPNNLNQIQVLLGNTPVIKNAVGPGEIIVTIPNGAKSGPFTIEVIGQGKSISKDSFIVYEPVTITKFEPMRGPVGTNVTITGTGFSPEISDNKVWIAGKPAQILGAGENQIIAQVSPGAVKGPVRVEVKKRGVFISKEEFIVELPPVILRVDPSEGAPGSLVTIIGDRFGTSINNVRVTLNGIPVPVESVTPSSIVFRVPQNVTSGYIQVTVIGQGTAQSSQLFTVVEPVMISGFQPVSGPPGTIVTIMGSGFPTGDIAKKITAVKLGNIPMQIVSVTTGEIKAVIPPMASTSRIEVSVKGRGIAISPLPFTVESGLAITRFYPIEGPPGTVVTIEGKGFMSRGIKVTLESVLLPKVQVISDTQIKVEVSKGAKSGYFVVTAPGLGEARAPHPFNLLPPLRIDSITPLEGPPGTLVVIKGAGFNPDIRLNTVKLGDIILPVEVATIDELQVRIPEGAKSGRITVIVGGRTNVTSRERFNVVVPKYPATLPLTPTKIVPKPMPAPVTTSLPSSQTQNVQQPPPPPPSVVIQKPTLFVQGFIPEEGPSGTEITIWGQGFGTNPSMVRVWIGNVIVPIVAIQDNQIRVRVTPEVVGGPIRVWRLDDGSYQTPNSFIRK